MITLTEAMKPILQGPRPADLVRLQEALLSCSADSGDAVGARQQALQVAGHFFTYLTQVQSKLSAREYSQLASWMDIGAVGAVAFEGLLTGRETSLRELLAGSLAESLMVLASRQYIKAWDSEAEISHSQAAWRLREALWRLSQEMQPDLSVEDRLAATRRLLMPLDGSELQPGSKILLVARLFQVILQIQVARLIQAA